MNARTLSIHEFLRLLWRRKALLAFVTLIAGGLAPVVAISLPPKYTAEGLLLIDNHTLSIPDLGAARQPSDAGYEASRNRTEIDVLRSWALIDNVVRDLNLVHNPALQRHDWLAKMNAVLSDYMSRYLETPIADTDRSAAAESLAVIETQRRLKVQSEPFSRMIQVRWTSSSPALSAAVVNGLLDRYLTEDETAKREMSAQAHDWLSERLVGMREEVEAADRRVQQFRNASRILAIQAGSLSAIQLNDALGQLSAARQDLTRQQFALTRLLQGNLRDGVASAPEVLGSALIQRLREHEAEVSQNLARIGERYWNPSSSL